MINNFTGVGRLTKDPDLRYSPSGVPMVRFTLAVNRPFSNQQGEKEADFIGCVAFRKQAENLANYMKKGNLIGITGRIQTGSYEGQDNKRVYTTDVIAEQIQFLERNSDQQGQQQQPNPQQQGGYQQQPSNQQNSGGNYVGGQPSYNTPPQQQYGGSPGYQQNQPPQQNHSRMDEDPFANNRGPIEVAEQDLPF